MNEELVLALHNVLTALQDREGELNADAEEIAERMRHDIPVLISWVQTDD